MCRQDWIVSTVCKQASYHALAEFYQSQAHKDAKEFGEEITRLTVSHTCIFVTSVQRLLCATACTSCDSFLHFISFLFNFCSFCWQKAKELIDKADTRGGLMFLFKSEQQQIYRSLEDAKKDNNFIYHARVPDHGKLPVIGAF